MKHVKLYIKKFFFGGSLGYTAREGIQNCVVKYRVSTSRMGLNVALVGSRIYRAGGNIRWAVIFRLNSKTY
jgi:hypothetical protein